MDREAQWIFISYRCEDTKHLAGRIADTLSTYSSVFMDLQAIGPGKDFTEQITTAVNDCRLMLVLIGPGWLKAADDAGRRRIDLPEDWVALEVRMALHRGVPVVPLLVDGAQMPTEQALPEDLKPLARRQAVPVSFESFRNDIEGLMRSLDIAPLPPKANPLQSELETVDPTRPSFRSLRWYHTGLSRAECVARVETATLAGVGTGFLLPGHLLHPRLPSGVLVTNAHIIPDALEAHEAIISFHGLRDPTARIAFRAIRTCWVSPVEPPGLNITLLELDSHPAIGDPLRVSPRMPRLDTSRRLGRLPAFVIGHPMGLEFPQFSLEDNALLDYNETTLHYRSPTQPGSSGSPVFDEQLQLIGVHHSGRMNMPLLHGKPGTYPANAGTRIHAVIDRLGRDLGRDLGPEREP